MVAITIALVGIVALHRLRPELDPRDWVLSEYFHGSSSQIARASAAAASVGLLLLAAAFWHASERGPVSALCLAGGGLLLLVGCILVTSDQVAYGAPPIETVQGGVHLAAVGVAFAATLAAMVAAAHQATSARHRIEAVVTAALAAIASLSFARFLMLDGPGRGLAERIAFGTVFVWAALAALRIARHR